VVVESPLLTFGYLEEFKTMLAQGQLGSAIAPIFTAGSSTVDIKTIIFFNSDNTTKSISVHVVPNSSGSLGAATSANQILNISLASGDTFEFSPAFPIRLIAANNSIQAGTTIANKVNYFINGVVN